MSKKNKILKFSSFGEALSHSLASRGLEQGWLASKIDVDEGLMSRYVNNKIKPRAKRRYAIGNVLGIIFKKLPNGDWQIIEKAYGSRILETKSSSINEIIDRLEEAENTIKEVKEAITNLIGIDK